MSEPTYKIAGFDTETFNGYVKVLAGSDGDFIETQNTYALVSWLFDKMQSFDYGFFFNIEYDYGSIFKDYATQSASVMRENRKLELQLNKLEKEHYKNFNKIKEIKRQLKELNTIKKFRVGEFKISIVNGKGFRITSTKRKRGQKSKVEFFDISNFYKSLDSYFTLDAVAEKYLNEHKNNEELGIDRKAIGEQEGYYEEHKNLIIKYCVNDALLTSKLGYKLFESLTNLGYTIPEKFYSKASIAKQVLEDLQFKNHSNKYAEKIARQSYHGGIFITYALGHYEDIINLDINSAYPFELQKLPEVDFDNGNSKILTPANPDFNKCDYKFYHIRATAIPILQYKANNGNIYYIDGNPSAGITSEVLDYWITQYDKDIIDFYGYYYDIIESYGIYNIEKKYPFKYINNLYQQKSEIKKKYGSTSIEYALQKIIINSTYGLLAQSKPRTTKFTNYIYASYITASCRYTILYIKKKLEDLGCKSIFIATDGIYSQLPKDPAQKQKVMDYIKTITNNELGGFSFDKFKSVTIFENGVYVEETEKGEIVMKRRGLSGKVESDDDVKASNSEAIVNKLKQTTAPFLEFKRSSPLKYNSAIIQHKEKNINMFYEVTKEINPYKSALSHYQIEDWVAGMSLKDYFTTQIELKLLNSVPISAQKKINILKHKNNI